MTIETHPDSTDDIAVRAADGNEGKTVWNGDVETILFSPDEDDCDDFFLAPDWSTPAWLATETAFTIDNKNGSAQAEEISTTILFSEVETLLHESSTKTVSSGFFRHIVRIEFSTSTGTGPGCNKTNDSGNEKSPD